MVDTVNLGTISVAKNVNGAWGGRTADEMKSIYENLYKIGTISAAHYVVSLSVYSSDSKIFNKSDVTQYVADGSLVGILKGEVPEKSDVGGIPLLGSSDISFLAQNCEFNNIDAQSDSVNIGHHQINMITGNGAGEITVNYIETRNGAIMNSAKAIKEVMFPRDGTQALPIDYLMVMTIFVFDRHSYTTRIFENKMLVALKSDSVPLDATNVNGVMIVPLTFVKMFPNIQVN